MKKGGSSERIPSQWWMMVGLAPPQKWMMPVKFQSLIFNSQQAGTKVNGNYWWKKSGTGQQK